MKELALNTLGMVAGILTTIAFLPQAVKTWKTKTAKDISLLMYPLLISGIILWIIYGFLIGSLPLILANSVTLFLAGAILFVKITYK
jgi:MtN3 and saliva related transmembrane protein